MKYRIVEFESNHCFVEKKKDFFSKWECFDKTLTFKLAKASLNLEILRDKQSIVRKIYNLDKDFQL